MRDASFDDAKMTPMVSRPLLFGALSAAVAACNAVVGFGDLEKVGDVSAPSEEKDASVRDTGAKDAAAPPPSVEAGSDAPVAASTTCPASGPAFFPAWKSPAPSRPEPCTRADIDTFVANEAKPFDAQRDAIAAQNAACAACVFTRESDGEWGPIVQTSDGRVYVAFGHCYAYAGAPDQCGDSAHELEWCLQKVCNVCSAGLSLADCRNTEREKSCKRGLDRTIATCSGSGTIVNTICRTSADVVATMCGAR